MKHDFDNSTIGINPTIEYKNLKSYNAVTSMQ